MIKMPKDTDFSYKEKRSNKQLFIDRFYQEYLSEKHAYGETFKTKAVTIFAVVQFLMAAAVAATKVFG